MSDEHLPTGEIFVVDRDTRTRTELLAIFDRHGFATTGFADWKRLLESARARHPACLLVDTPKRGALEILKRLNAAVYPAPIVVMSAHGNIPMAVEAIRNGATDFIKKPFNAETVLGRVKAAIEAWGQDGGSAARSIVRKAYFPGRELLTRREMDVLDHISTGASSKEIARRLGVSFRTVEVHRAHLMEKVGAKNSVDLMRIVLRSKS